MDTAILDAPQINSWEILLLRSAAQISLTAPQYEKIKKRYENLQTILDASADPLLQGAHILIQGSIGLGTTVKPAPGAEDEMATIDADAIIVLPNAAGAAASSVLEAIETRFREGTRVENPIVQLRRGIRIVYSDENPGFHIDITPARPVAGNLDQKGCGNLEVPDREDGWKCSSPREYCVWLDDVAKSRINVLNESYTFDSIMRSDRTAIAKSTQDPIPDFDAYMESNPLKAAIKLMKRHRDVWAISSKKKSVRPISAIITTLATHAYEEIVYESVHRPLRPVEVMIQIVARMPDFIERTNGAYEVLNPRDPGENFAEKWNRPNGEGIAYKTAFDGWHARAVTDIKLGLTDFGRADAFETAVNERFGLSKAFITEVTQQLPKDWTLPGRKSGTTINALSFAALTGASTAATASQTSIKPVDRLG